jgi:hypothetical protein
MGKPYAKPKRGEWVQPVRKGYKMACCDCGLVHDMDFRIVKDHRGNFIQFRVARNERSTAMKRRHMGRRQIKTFDTNLEIDA